MSNGSNDERAATRKTWENVPEYQKMVYLYEWCEQLAYAVQQQEKKIQGLQERLRKVESRAQKKSSKPKR